MLRIATELAEVKKQSGLPLAALDEAVRVEQLLYDSRLSYRWVVHCVVLRGVRSGARGVCRVPHVTTIHAECPYGETVPVVRLHAVSVVATISTRAGVLTVVGTCKHTMRVIHDENANCYMIGYNTHIEY